MYKCQRVTKLGKDLQIKITRDKISKNKIANRLVSYLNDREIEKQDRAPLREAPRAHRVSTEAKRQWWYRRPKQIKKKRWRQACSHETLFLSTVVSFSRFCHHHRRLIPSSFYSPSPSLVIQLFHLASVLVIFARERDFYRLRFNRFASVVNTETKRTIKGDNYFVYTRC